MAELTSQEKAIAKTTGPCIVLAGAGTGKTYTIIQKIKHIVDDKLYNPEEILCLTFSNEATNHLREELIKENIKNQEKVVVKTFHSFCSDVLKEDGERIGVNPDFEILLPDDAKVMLYKYLNIAPYWSNRYISTIHTAKDFGVSLSQIEEYNKKQLPSLLRFGKEEDLEKIYEKMNTDLNTIYLSPLPKSQQTETKKELKEFIEKYDDYTKFKKFVELWKKYDAFKKEKSYLDYSDLNYYVLELFTKFGSEKYTERYKYVLIDEFQDTNFLQFQLINYIATHKNITVVGDPNQSIYGFRGAYKDNLDEFKKNFNVNDTTDIFYLDKSRRSPNTVLNIAFDLIKTNYENNVSACHLSSNYQDRQGDKVKIIELVDNYEEARCIADIVLKKIENKVPLKEIAVLVRTHAQAEVIKQALIQKGIKYTYSGKTNFLRFREVKTIISYLSILSNIMNRAGIGDQGWWHLFHYSNELSPSDSLKIGRYLKEKRDDKISIDQALFDSKIELSEDGKRIVEKVVSKLNELSKLSNKALPDLVLDVYELSGLNRAFTYERSPENIEHLYNLKKFYEITENFYKIHSKELVDFINYLEIIDKLEINIESSYRKDIDAVRLMTIHASKGLEFDTVILTNLAEKRFPIGRTPNEPLIPKELIPDRLAEIKSWKEGNNLNEKQILEKLKTYERSIFLFEERRLCYVGFTRAKNNLILTYAKSYNQEKGTTTLESTFLDEIKYKQNTNTEYLEDIDQKSTIISPSSRSEEYSSELKYQLINSLDVDSTQELITRLLKYLVSRKKDPGTLIQDLKASSPDISILNQAKQKIEESKSGLIFTTDSHIFSPSSLSEYLECPKKFELHNLYQMPSRGDFEEADEGGTSPLDLGSFVHKILETIVKDKVYNKEEAYTLATAISKNKDFKNKILEADLITAKQLIDVFWVRDIPIIKASTKSETEIKLNLDIDNYKFVGYADRVDYNKDGTINIIDYKTNKSSIDTSKRKIQLGFYALAKQSQGYKINILSLNMLRLEKPVELIVNKEDQEQVTGSTGTNSSANFKLSELREEIRSICNNIAKDYEHNFQPTTDQNKCKFCGYKLYCPKWIG